MVTSKGKKVQHIALGLIVAVKPFEEVGIAGDREDRPPQRGRVAFAPMGQGECAFQFRVVLDIDNPGSRFGAFDIAPDPEHSVGFTSKHKGSFVTLVGCR